MWKLLMCYLVMSICLSFSLLTSFSSSLLISGLGCFLFWYIKKALQNYTINGDQIDDFFGVNQYYIIYSSIIIFGLAIIYMLCFQHIHSSMPLENMMPKLPDMDGQMDSGQLANITQQENNIIDKGSMMMALVNMLICGSMVMTLAYKLFKTNKDIDHVSQVIRIMEGKINRPFKIKQSIILDNGMVLKEGGILKLDKRLHDLSWMATYIYDGNEIQITSSDNKHDLFLMNIK